MHTAYVSDRDDRFTALADMSNALAEKIPQCPDCQRPVRQYVTRRYNRLINRAVIDESSKRFLVNRRMELNNLEMDLGKLREEITASHQKVVRFMNLLSANSVMTFVEAETREHYADCWKLRRRIQNFHQRTSDRYRPSHRLYESTIHAKRRRRSDSLSNDFGNLSVEKSSDHIERDRRVTLAGEMALLKLDFTTLEDKLGISLALRSVILSQRSRWLDGLPVLVESFLESCAAFVLTSNTENLPKLSVEAALYHATIAQMYRSCRSFDEPEKARAMDFVEDARRNLGTALLLCQKPFEHADELKEAVKSVIKLLQKERYETLSPDELAAIKDAMVTGPGGLATNSGYWYNCVNGHPVRFLLLVLFAFEMTYIQVVCNR